MPDTQLILRYAARSDVGRLRAKNDDSAYAGRHLAVVADGMGGHAGGDVASASTVLDLIHLDHGDYAERATADLSAFQLAQLASAGKGTTIGRRKLIQRSAGAAAGIFGLGLGIAAIGPLIRNPWAKGDDSPLWHTVWRPEHGETVYLVADLFPAAWGLASLALPAR